MFQDFNNPNSFIYKKNLNIMNSFIDEKLPNSKSELFHNEAKISGSVEDIVKFCGNTARNLIKDFFRNCELHGYSKKMCSHCKIPNQKRLEKAHCNNPGFERPDLLKKAVMTFWIDKHTPIPSNKIYKEFILLHKTCPLFLLKPECHRKYDQDKHHQNQYNDKDTDGKTNNEWERENEDISELCDKLDKCKIKRSHTMSTRLTRNITNSLRKYSTSLN